MTACDARRTHANTPCHHTLVCDVAGWPAHRAGQHVDLRLTAADGYQAQRSYSLAAPADGERVELGIELIEEGELG